MILKGAARAVLIPNMMEISREDIRNTFMKTIKNGFSVSTAPSMRKYEALIAISSLSREKWQMFLMQTIVRICRNILVKTLFRRIEIRKSYISFVYIMKR